MIELERTAGTTMAPVTGPAPVEDRSAGAIQQWAGQTLAAARGSRDDPEPTPPAPAATAERPAALPEARPLQWVVESVRNVRLWCKHWLHTPAPICLDCHNVIGQTMVFQNEEESFDRAITRTKVWLEEQFSSRSEQAKARPDAPPPPWRAEQNVERSSGPREAREPIELTEATPVGFSECEHSLKAPAPGCVSCRLGCEELLRESHKWGPARCRQQDRIMP